MVTVEITYDESDYLRAVKLLSRRQSRVFNGLIALGIVVVGAMLYRAKYNEMGWWVKPFFGAWFIFFMILLRMVQLRKTGKIRKSTPAAQGPHIWRLNGEGIRITGELSASELKWEAIIKAQETRRDFFFFTSKSRALFLPKRVFANNSQIIDLRDLMRNKLGAKSQLI